MAKQKDNEETKESMWGDGWDSVMQNTTHLAIGKGLLILI